MSFYTWGLFQRKSTIHMSILTDFYTFTKIRSLLMWIHSTTRQKLISKSRLQKHIKTRRSYFTAHKAPVVIPACPYPSARWQKQKALSGSITQIQWSSYYLNKLSFPSFLLIVCTHNLESSVYVARGRVRSQCNVTFRFQHKYLVLLCLVLWRQINYVGKPLRVAI